jgi:hypothetical protein
MSEFQHLLRKVRQGRSGKVVSIPLPYERLAQHLDITQSQMVAIGGNTGTGKSSLAHELFILHLFDWWLEHRDSTEIKVKIFVYSMERAKEVYLAKWMAYRLWKKYKILAHSRLILGRVPNFRVSNKLMTLIKQEKAYFEDMEQIVTLMTGPKYASQIEKHIKKWVYANGKIETYNEKLGLKRYVPDDPNLLTIVILDHIGKVKVPKGRSKKQTIDETSAMLGRYRDLFGISPVVVSQLNRNISDIQRRKFGESFFPEEQDFKDTGNVCEDADVVLGLMDPSKFGLKQVLKYPIEKFISRSGHNRFRTLTVIKNTLGGDGIHLPLNFVGEVGQFRELKRPIDMKKEDFLEAKDPKRRPIP